MIYNELSFIKPSPYYAAVDAGSNILEVGDAPGTTTTLRPGDHLSLGGVLFSLRQDTPPVPPKFTIGMVFSGCAPPWFSGTLGPDCEVALESKDIDRWTCAALALRRYGARNAQPDADGYPPFLLRGSGLQSTSLLDDYEGFSCTSWAVAAMYGASMLYAIPHFLGWNAAFDTAVERTLWHVAIIVLPLIGVPVAVNTILCYALNDIVPGIDYLGVLVYSTLLFAMPFVYACANDYILAASVRHWQLFVLPVDIFMQPSLASYWPHFSR